MKSLLGDHRDLAEDPAQECPGSSLTAPVVRLTRDEGTEGSPRRPPARARRGRAAGLKPFGRQYLGVRAIPLNALVGTDSRASSFTRDFRPLHAFSRDRLRSLEAAFADGAFPPIVVVKLGGTYFVIDGHHRAALARRGGAGNRSTPT